MDLDRLDQLLDRAVAADEFSGVVRITRGREVLYETARGQANRADGIPVALDTRFAIASVTKLLTAVAAARLVDKGKLRFDTPIDEVLPPGHRPRAAGPGITVHHLLTHSSGLGDYFAEDDPDADYADLWRVTPSTVMRRASDFVPLLADLPVRAEPGAATTYNDAAYVFLGLVLEAASGLEFPELITREVLEPAGMSDTAFLALDGVHPRVAVGYLPPGDGRPNWSTNVYAVPAIGGPDGGIYATAGDLQRFLAAVDRGGLLRPATRDLMFTVHTEEAEYDIQWGYGFMLIEREGVPLAGSDGEDPGASARAFRVRGTELDVVVLSNINEAADPVWKLLLKLLPGTL
jgi:CubicO group peptidase (beta-lactamase class C family)